LYLYFYPIYNKIGQIVFWLWLVLAITGEKKTRRVGGVLAVLKKPLEAIRAVSTLS
jgi:hypothetical protein